MLNTSLTWLKARLKERTSWDGLGLIAVGLLTLNDTMSLYVALGAIGWGAWTFLKKG